jgi:hypothetical protein
VVFGFSESPGFYSAFPVLLFLRRKIRHFHINFFKRKLAIILEIILEKYFSIHIPLFNLNPEEGEREMSTIKKITALAVAVAAVLFSVSETAVAQKKSATAATAGYDTSLFRAMKWRNIGPFRGGRVTAVAGVPNQPLVYYMGATGGGVWKTDDGGINWKPIADAYFKTGSVGAIEVAPSDPNVIYAGMGEACVRGNFSHGDGVYKSTDAGKTWKHVGLSDTRQIGKIRIHPQNPDLLYVAALGHIFGPNTERGVFRSKDGGKNWERILYKDDRPARWILRWIRPTRAFFLLDCGK